MARQEYGHFIGSLGEMLLSCSLDMRREYIEVVHASLFGSIYEGAAKLIQVRRAKRHTAIALQRLHSTLIV